MIPTSTQEKISQRVSPSLALELPPVVKKSVIHLALAVECLVADMMTQAAATENAAESTIP